MSSLSPQILSTTSSWAARMTESVLQNYPASAWKWHYEHGLFVRSVLELGLKTGEPATLQFVIRWLDHFITPNGEIRTYRLSDFNLDQINPGRILFYAYQKTLSPRYLKAIELLNEQLCQQPRTSSGGFWHKKIYPNQMWLDGLYMAGPFRAYYASVFGDPVIFNDITHQFLLMEEHVRDPQTGLLYHGWDESRMESWARPENGCSSSVWGRGMGWFVMALIDVLDILPETHPDRLKLVGILRRSASALVHFQDQQTGLWWQVLNYPGRPGNYLESSVTAMLVYVFCKAVRTHHLEAEYLLAARRAYRGLLENKIKVDPSGRLTLEGTCGVAGLGGSPYRDGSYDYYVSEPTISNDFKGVGPFILATLEMESSGGEKIP
jgi:unsaturated rhamnogalacturonyl hydrolase